MTTPPLGGATRWRSPEHHPPATVRTLVDLLRFRAAEAPGALQHVFLGDGEQETARWTRDRLHRRAMAVAAALTGVAPGERALLVHPPGLDTVAALFGCLYAGVLAVPAHPPDPARLSRTVPRMRAIAADCGATVVLSHSTLDAVAAEVPDLRWIATDTLPDATVEPRAAAPDDLAYLQYTSGSTSAPKGVMVSHRNLVHQLADFNEGYDHRPGSVMVTWLPGVHDLGLVYGLLLPVFMGFPSVVLPPLAFLQRPIRWPAAISRYRGTHSPAPNFAFDLCVHKTRPEERAGLDLSSWRVALNGAEPIRQESEAAFVHTYAAHGFAPEAISHAFGMSEATAKVTSEHLGTPAVFVSLDPEAYERHEAIEAPGGRIVAGCGVTAGDTRVAIVDPDTRDALPEGRVGEVWVAGTTVAQGYWGNAEATERTFHARTRGGDGPFLRTGDLGFVRGETLFLSGRLKDVVIIRGQNHYPQDVEWTISSRHPAFRPNCAAAFGVDVAGEERLVVVTEVYAERIDDPTEVVAAVRDACAEHGLAVWSVALIGPRELPKTSSGKIQRGKAKAMFLDGAYRPIHSWTAADRVDVGDEGVLARMTAAAPRDRGVLLLEWVTALTAGLVGLAPADIDVDRPLREQGIDSVTAVELVERIGRDTGLSFGTSAAFDHPTLAAITAHVLDRLWPAAAVPADIAAMTDDEVEAALLAELAELE